MTEHPENPASLPAEAEKLIEEAEKLIEEAEELLEEAADLEQCAREGRPAPRAKVYRFRVNDTLVEWHSHIITGREVLTAAGLVPPDEYVLRLKLAGSKPEVVKLDQEVDLRRHGVEKFRAIKGGQGEGEFTPRRQAVTIDQDRAFLDNYGLQWEAVVDGSTWILLHQFPMPPGYTVSHVTLAIRMEGGYPFTALDMMYLHPPVARADGKPIEKADVIQQIDGLAFQRWSRHRTNANPWVSGEDCLETHIYLVEEFFAEELKK